MLQLIPKCDDIKQLTTICRLCKAPGCFTFRKADKETKKLVGADNLYITLCRECHRRETKLNQDIVYDGDPTKVYIEIEREEEKLDNEVTTLDERSNVVKPEALKQEQDGQ